MLKCLRRILEMRGSAGLYVTTSGTTSLESLGLVCNALEREILAARRNCSSEPEEGWYGQPKYCYEKTIHVLLNQLCSSLWTSHFWFFLDSCLFTITRMSTIKLNTNCKCLGQLHVVNNSRSLQGNFAPSAGNQNARTVVTI